MTKNQFSKIAIVAIILGLITMYLSSIPYMKEYSKPIEIVGSIPFYGGIVALVVLFLSRLGK